MYANNDDFLGHAHRKRQEIAKSIYGSYNPQEETSTKEDFSKAMAPNDEDDEEEEPTEDKTDIEKGGEGSKGGKVIGHTASGKPIYASRDSNFGRDFSHQDHHEAAQAHLAAGNDSEAKKHMKASKYLKQSEGVKVGAKVKKTSKFMKDSHKLHDYDNGVVVGRGKEGEHTSLYKKDRLSGDETTVEYTHKTTGEKKRVSGHFSHFHGH